MLAVSGMRIENATIHDAEEILALQKEAFLEQARIYGNIPLPALAQSIESIKQEFAGRTFLKAVFDNRIIASVRYDQRDNLVNIHRLIVKPSFQNQGIGTYLMKAVEDRFPHGAIFHLFTGDKSTRNIHLYTKLGYTVIYKENIQDLVLIHMEKQLDRDVR